MGDSKIEIERGYKELDFAIKELHHNERLTQSLTGQAFALLVPLAGILLGVASINGNLRILAGVAGILLSFLFLNNLLRVRGLAKRAFKIACINEKIVQCNIYNGEDNDKYSNILVKYTSNIVSVTVFLIFIMLLYFVLGTAFFLTR